jgi:hypothetical protein
MYSRLESAALLVLTLPRVAAAEEETWALRSSPSEADLAKCLRSRPLLAHQ